jgi:DNA adenine methylase
MTAATTSGGDCRETFLPFLKWAGGKRALAPVIRSHFPVMFGHYFEPFLGGGAVFFDWPHAPAILSDANARLIRCYRGIAHDVDRVVELLRALRYNREMYEDVRSWDVDSLSSDASVAAWLIYLNRCGFNGLYRVNQAGKFNVPFGRYGADHSPLDEPRLRAASRALQASGGLGAHEGALVFLIHGDFEEVLDGRVDAGDLVYFDPPYVPLSPTSSFVGYAGAGFGAADQKRLRNLAVRLVERGATVIASNSSAPLAVELWSVEPFVIHRVSAKRNINSKADRRGAVEEILAMGRPS